MHALSMNRAPALDLCRSAQVPSVAIQFSEGRKVKLELCHFPGAERLPSCMVTLRTKGGLVNTTATLLHRSGIRQPAANLGHEFACRDAKTAEVPQI